MSEKYKDLTVVEIQTMIKELNDELNQRILDLKNSLVGKVLIDGLKTAGYRDEELVTAEQLQEAISQWVPKSNVAAAQTKKKRIVGPKYMHPATKEVWAGRGAFAPQWVQKILNERNWSLEKFKNSNEFKVGNDIVRINENVLS